MSDLFNLFIGLLGVFDTDIGILLGALILISLSANCIYKIIK